METPALITGWATVVLAIVTLALVGVTFWYARQTRRMAQETKRMADVAERQAEAMIKDYERRVSPIAEASITIDPEKIGHWIQYKVTLQNKGFIRIKLAGAEWEWWLIEQPGTVRTANVGMNRPINEWIEPGEKGDYETPEIQLPKEAKRTGFKSSEEIAIDGTVWCESATGHSTSIPVKVNVEGESA